MQQLTVKLVLNIKLSCASNESVIMNLWNASNLPAFVVYLLITINGKAVITNFN